MTLWRGRQTKQDPRLNPVQQALVARRGRVVKLVDDDEIVVVAWQGVPELPRIKALNGDEQMIQYRGLVLGDQQITEIVVSEDGLEAAEALPEYLFPVR